jgi:hypothetical protein
MLSHTSRSSQRGVLYGCSLSFIDEWGRYVFCISSSGMSKLFQDKKEL